MPNIELRKLVTDVARILWGTTWNKLIFATLIRVFSELSDIADQLQSIIEDWISRHPELNEHLVTGVRIFVIFVLDTGNPNAIWILIFILTLLIGVVVVKEVRKTGNGQKAVVEELRRGLEKKDFNLIFTELENIAKELKLKGLINRIVRLKGSYYSNKYLVEGMKQVPKIDKMKNTIGTKKEVRIEKVKSLINLIEKSLPKSK